METVVLSDLIGMSDPGRAAIRAFANAKPVGIDPAAAVFAAELRPPKLSYQWNKFRNSNPIPEVPLPPTSTKDPNTKMKEFKERLKMSKVEGADVAQSTGLFSFSDLTTTGDTKDRRGISHSNSHDTTSANSNADINKTKQKKTTIPRFKNTGGVDVDIHHRINKAFQSIESLGKGYTAFSKTLQEATARAIADGKLSQKLLANSPKASEVQTFRNRTTRPAVKIDVTRPINKMFGLDPTNILQTSESDEDTDATGSDVEVTDHLKKLTLTGKSFRRRGKRVNQNTTRSPSPEITVIKDKRFLARHEKQGNLLNKDIADMRSQLAVGDKKMQREARQVNIDLKHSRVQRPSNLTRLMAYNPDKGTGRRLIDFLQSTGGIFAGWDPEDHNLFVKMYSQWKNQPSRITNVIKKEMPDKSVEQIVDHICWYEKYEALNKDNKDYVHKWQMAQRREKDAIYRLARNEKVAETHTENKKHDLLRGKRDEERQRNKVKLDGWKSSLALEKKMLRINVDFIREPENETRIVQLQEDMKNMKKRFSSLQPKHPDVRKYLSAKKLADTTGSLNSKVEGSPGTPSSGIFSDEDVSGVSRKMSQNGNTKPNTSTKHSISLPAAHSRHFSNKASRRSFQSRDAQMIEAKRKSIQAKLEKTRNKSILTPNQIKEHMSKNDAPSKVLNATKGWLLHQEAKKVETLEATGTKYKGILLNHNISRVPTSKMFQPGPSVRLIPKLGTPEWRKQ